VSAYQCTRCHISLLAGAIEDGSPQGWTEAGVRKRYAELNAANALSVQVRYPHGAAPAYEPQPCFACAMTRDVPPLALYKAVQCYYHQACEPAEFDESRLGRALERLREETMRRYLIECPEYLGHAWGYKPRHGKDKS
jgi:hypothetical protein